MRAFKAGVIGLGMGGAHANSFSKNPDVELAAVCDLDEKRVQAVAEKHGVKATYTDPMEMIEKANLDICFVATPNNLHKPLTIAALEAGCHVICEKPMALNAQEAQDMIDVAERVGKRLMINFSFRFTPQSWQLKKEIEDGLLGDIYYGRTQWLRRRGMPRFGGWFGQKALSGGGPLIDLGVHRLDLALWLMGYPKPTWVMGKTYNPIGSRVAKEEGKEFDVEDLAVAMVEFENGASLQLEASWATYVKEKEFISTHLFGTQGGLVQRNLNEGYDFEAEIYVERNGCHYNMQPTHNIPSPKGATGHLVECLLEDKPHTATAQEGLLVMKLLDAIYESADKGEPVKIG